MPQCLAFLCTQVSWRIPNISFLTLNKKYEVLFLDESLSHHFSLRPFVKISLQEGTGHYPALAILCELDKGSEGFTVCTTAHLVVWVWYKLINQLSWIEIRQSL